MRIREGEVWKEEYGEEGGDGGRERERECV